MRRLSPFRASGAYFSRTYGYYNGGVNYCAVGFNANGSHVGATHASTATYNADLCSLFSQNYGNYWDECRAFSYGRVARYTGGSDYVGGHYHYSHSPPRYSCPVQGA